MIRMIYSFLVRMHPRAFRNQFGEQMLSIFDDSCGERGSLRLLADASMSLLRQWLWRPPVRPVFAGWMPPLNELHRVSNRLQRKANLVTLAWVLSIIPLELAVAGTVQPTTRTFNALWAYGVMPIAIFFFLYTKCSVSEGSFASILNRSREERTALERKRDTLQSRLERMGLALILGLTIWLSPILFFGLLFRSTHVFRNWGFVNSVVFAVQTLVFFAIVRGPTRQALDAIEQEIEASRFAQQSK
jgi:hypothetical protein